MATISEEAEDSNGTAPTRPRTGQRKSSFSDALSKFTTTTLNRRRTATLLPPSSSSTHIYQQSRLPTPSGIPRSTSFFSSLNTFAPKPSCRTSASDEEDPLQPPTKRTCKDSDRLSQTPFFVSQQHNHQRLPTAPFKSASRRRESCVKIETRGLMQPMHPPLPKSSTMGNLLSAQITLSKPSPRAGRPTSSGTTRKDIVRMPARNNVLTPPTRIVKASKTPIAYPTRKDSLLPPPARAAATTVSLGNEAAADEYCANSEDDTVHHTHNSRASILEESSISMSTSNASKASLHKGKSSRFHEIRVDEQEVALEDDHADMQGAMGPLPPRTLSDSDLSDPRFIHCAQSPTYWLARYTAVSDLFRSSALPSSTSTTTPLHAKPPSASTSTLSSSNHFHPMHDLSHRDRSVFARLRGLCTTEEARESLAVFERLIAEREEGRGRVKGGTGYVDGGSKRAKKSTGGTVKEKMGWLEGLMGKRRISSGKGVKDG